VSGNLVFLLIGLQLELARAARAAMMHEEGYRFMVLPHIFVAEREQSKAAVEGLSLAA
jgi:hypothetical protein